MTAGLYYPCKVVLKSGSYLDYVYLTEASKWYESWGVWPKEDKGKFSIRLEDIRSVESSPSRLPATFANKLYSAGESGMGYSIYTVVFSDGTQQAYGGGNAVDFIDFPQGQSVDTVADVLPHVGRDDPLIRIRPNYHWCLYRKSTWQNRVLDMIS